jgi:acetolactate synthase-1/2/3 large subunit
MPQAGKNDVKQRLDVKMRNGGRLLVESLVSLGATKGFGVPGESYLAVLDALHDTQGRFDFVLCRNEGGAAFMAAAWGKLMGQPGLCFVTRGPASPMPRSAFIPRCRIRRR